MIGGSKMPESYTRDEMNQRIQRAKYAAHCAENYRIIHKYYCDNRYKLADKYAIAPGFVSYTDIAVKHGVMIELMKLYDKEGRSLSIHNLYSDCVKNKGLFHRHLCEKDGKVIDYQIEEVLKRFNAQLKPFKKPLDNLWKQRNLIWAHTDRAEGIDPIKVEDNYPITWGEIEDVLFITLSLLQELQDGLKGQRTAERIINAGDIDNLFAHVKVYLDKESVKSLFIQIDLNMGK